MPRLPQTSYKTSFAIIAATFALMTTGGTLPIPLYTLWGKEFGFGPETTTWIFAIYVFGTLLALIFFGGLSDQVGRRPLAIGALILAIASTLFFIFAANVPMLLAARLLSGFSVGLITSAATAALSELFRGRNKALPAIISTAANMGGLGLGPLLAGVFAQYLPAPTVLIFVVFISLVVAVTALTFFVPETHPRTSGAKINWAPRVGVPALARTVYWKSALAVFPTFTLLGLFSSLTPRFIAQTLQIHNLAIAGLATFVLFEIGVTAQILFKSRRARKSLLLGLPLLILSLALVLAGFLNANVVLFAAGTVTGGFGAGLVFVGGLGQLTGVVDHESHAKSVSAFFIAAQSGLAVPVLSIGALTPTLGLTGATTAVIVTVTVLAAIALAINAKSASVPASMKHAPAQAN
jgi:MFS family permease